MHKNSPQTVFFLLLYNSVGDVCNNCTCEIGYYYSYIVEECICKIMSIEVNMHTHFNFNLPFIALDPEEVYQYEATVLEGCDPERNAEYRMIIAAETTILKVMNSLDIMIHYNYTVLMTNEVYSYNSSSAVFLDMVLLAQSCDFIYYYIVLWMIT